ncbi:Uncharacterised protein [Vibrio cholerae]|nr:Uncharacterised protein [Vibrio cholerae]CSI46266.1 Uncharacterised protein [Vibrio cholerae]
MQPNAFWNTSKSSPQACSTFNTEVSCNNSTNGVISSSTVGSISDRFSPSNIWINPSCGKKVRVRTNSVSSITTSASRAARQTRCRSPTWLII